MVWFTAPSTCTCAEQVGSHHAFGECRHGRFQPGPSPPSCLSLLIRKPSRWAGPQTFPIHTPDAPRALRRSRPLSKVLKALPPLPRGEAGPWTVAQGPPPLRAGRVLPKYFTKDLYNLRKEGWPWAVVPGSGSLQSPRVSLPCVQAQGGVPGRRAAGARGVCVCPPGLRLGLCISQALWPCGHPVSERALCVSGSVSVQFVRLHPGSSARSRLSPPCPSLSTQGPLSPGLGGGGHVPMLLTAPPPLPPIPPAQS